MFWGLIMEPGRCYTQTVKVSFHVSMAALDISNSSDEPSQVMCVFEGRNYLVCTLNKKDKLQCPLDLNFEAGTKVSFATNGKSHVHLTGYLTSMEDDFGEEEQEEEEEETETVTKKDKKRLKKQLIEGPPKKKTKIAKQNSISSSAEEVEEEDSSDSEFLLDKLEEEEEEGEDEDEGEEEEDEAEGEEEEASSLSEAESEEEVESAKPKQNGIAKTNSSPLLKKKEKAEKVKPQKEKPQKQEGKKEQKQQESKGKKAVLKGGVMIQDLKEGSGEIAKTGKFVTVYYEGRLKDNNKMFDSTTKGPGFKFRIGKGEVIKGWDIGLVGMKVGGKRRITCPANAAYGAKGSPPVIPPNATLVFDVELKKIS